MRASDLFDETNEVYETNRTREKPKIPELPKTKEECNELLKKSLECLSTSGPQEDYQPGMVAETTSEMKCPFCGMKFAQFNENGCFNSSSTPRNCPNCGFPGSIEKRWLALTREEKRT